MERAAGRRHTFWTQGSNRSKALAGKPETWRGPRGAAHTFWTQGYGMACPRDIMIDSRTNSAPIGSVFIKGKTFWRHLQFGLSDEVFPGAKRIRQSR